MAGEGQGLEEQRAVFAGFPGLALRMGVRKLTAGEARIVGEGDGGSVVLFFSHADFPGSRFAYRAKPPGADRYEEVWLAEELATGGLHRLLRDAGTEPDATGIIWLRLHGQVLRRQA